MTDLFKNIHRRLDMLQRKTWFKVTASILVLIGAGVLFGSVLGVSYNLDAQRTAIERALEDQNLEDQDEYALSLAQTGTVVVNGKTYGGPFITDRLDSIFDREGNIVSARAVTALLMQGERPDWAPEWLVEQPGTTWLLAIVFTVWLLAVIWMQITVALLWTMLATAIPVAICIAVDSRAGLWMFAGFGLLTFTFVLLSRIFLLLFDRPQQTLAVAHTVLKEASRTRLSLVFIAALLLTLPLLPMFLDPDAPLRFRVQTFISRSFGLTFFIAASFTLFLACSSVSFEIRDRQIWQIVSKPVSRLQYLLGKWLGVVTLNAIILMVAGVSIFVYIQYLRTLPTAPGIEGRLDAIQVRDSVLTARVGTFPDFDRLPVDDLRQRVEQYIERDTELSQQPEISRGQRNEIARQIAQAYIAQQRSIPPGGGAREYKFTNLGAAARHSSALTLRFKFYILSNDPHETYDAAFYFNDRPDTMITRTYVPTMSHTILIGPDMIQDDGTLTVAIGNLYMPPPDSPYGSINFDADGLELMYKVAPFEGNFLRAVLLTWAKLSFLGMIGIFFATFLSFPVACLAAFTLFIGGTLTPFLATALQEFYPIPLAQLDWGNLGQVITWAFKSVIRFIGNTLVFTLGGFGSYSPRGDLVQGLFIPWWRVFRAFFWLVLVSSGGALLISFATIRNRELATYSGHG